VLGFSLNEFGEFQDAMPIWQKLIKLAPDDSTGPQGLGSSMLGLKRYGEAASALEDAVKLSPEVVGLHLKLGSAYLLAGDDDRAIAAYQKALDLDPQPLWFNDVAYQLAEANKRLSVALEYARKAVKEEEEASQKLNLQQLQVEDLSHTASLAAFWDTLGWVYFQMGNLTEAEKYLDAAWSLSLGSVEANHLGQVYVRRHKTQAAVHMYRMALSRLSARVPTESPQKTQEAKKIEERLERLSPGKSALDFHNTASVLDDVNGMRTIKLARLVPGTENADFFLVFARDSQASSARIEDVKFISGSEVLKSADKAPRAAGFKVPLPNSGQPKLLRRGILGCYKYSGCSLTLLIPSDVHSVN
jgi:tetratricopeptide (TPR) repeat protein